MQGKTMMGQTMAVLFLALLMPACLIVSGGEHEEGDCFTECRDYEVCESYCDAYTCTEHCWDETSCDTVCDSGEYFPNDSDFNEPDRCYSDIECDVGRICINGTCRAADTDERGGAGLCQNCESRADCVEEDALCLGFNYDENSGPTETVCGRSCNSDPDCPGGFICVTVDDGPNQVGQCVPELGESSERTCQASEDLECVTAGDCSVGERCYNNSCEPPTDAECTDDSDCSGGDSCQVFECVEDDSTACVGSEDCSDGETCFDGQCVAEAQSCVYNVDCADDQRCVDGECTLTCDEHADCANSERCRQGICEYVQCYQSSDCPAGDVCVDASCEQACAQDNDCSTGFLCAGLGYCEPDPDVECRSSAECSPDEQCVDGGVCEPTCTCNADCAGDQICGSDSGLCVDDSPDDDGIQC